MDVVVTEAPVELRVPQAKRSSSQILLHGVLFVVTVAIVIIGLRIHVPHGITAVNAVAFGLTLVWAVAALIANRYSDRTAAGPDPYALLIAADSLLAAVALTAGRLGQHESVHSFGAAKSVATIAALLVTAVSFHFLAGPARRATAGDGTAHGGCRGVCGRSGDRRGPRDRQARTLRPRGRSSAGPLRPSLR